MMRQAKENTTAVVALMDANNNGPRNRNTDTPAVGMGNTNTNTDENDDDSNVNNVNIEDFDFETFQAKFAKDISDTKDGQAVNSATLLELQTQFATAYSQLLSDLDYSLEVLDKLERADELADAILARYESPSPSPHTATNPDIATDRTNITDEWVSAWPKTKKKRIISKIRQ